MTVLKNEIQVDYKNRINRVFQFIDENLDSDISLSKVAEIAYFSPFHFHRVFKTITGETLNGFITRRKIEKAALDILHKKCSISEISHIYGFSDNSAFTKAFKKFYGISPTEFKRQNPNRFTKIRQLKSKNGQEYPDFDKYICIIDNLKKWIKMNAKIEIKEMSKANFMYISCLGSQELAGAFQKLISWAVPRGLMNERAKLMTIYHDSLKVTEEEKARLSACFILDKSIETGGEIELSEINAGRYIIGNFEIKLEEFEKSWTSLYLWMNEHGYKKADRDVFEIYHNNFNEHPEKKAIVDFCIPIE
ncbi:AraC family transcriptional regulator [Marivirga sp. S37H4]|uniref:AraC family transcriptional regulator n=1 Tax=Marivirga aurantiaca TaxID=2802615 RepID=A0A935CB16_9BACT|nr:AraC family transcriptional regulator [Marivirga aurantiaca]MBK6265123.1 AraC family transcriptional regulator [Marivirga aurantiaca]